MGWRHGVCGRRDRSGRRRRQPVVVLESLLAEMCDRVLAGNVCVRVFAGDDIGVAWAGGHICV